MSKTEVIQEAFLADDVAAIDALVQYPLAYIGDGTVQMLDEYPIKPSALRRRRTGIPASTWYTR